MYYDKDGSPMELLEWGRKQRGKELEPPIQAEIPAYVPQSKQTLASLPPRVEVFERLQCLSLTLQRLLTSSETEVS